MQVKVWNKIPLHEWTAAIQPHRSARYKHTLATNTQTADKKLNLLMFQFPILWNDVAAQNFVWDDVSSSHESS